MSHTSESVHLHAAAGFSEPTPIHSPALYHGSFLFLFNIRWKRFCFAQPLLSRGLSLVTLGSFCHLFPFVVPFEFLSNRGTSLGQEWGLEGGPGRDAWCMDMLQLPCCSSRLFLLVLKPLGEELEWKTTFLFKLSVYQFPLGLCLCVEMCRQAEKAASCQASGTGVLFFFQMSCYKPVSLAPLCLISLCANLFILDSVMTMLIVAVFLCFPAVYVP